MNAFSVDLEDWFCVYNLSEAIPFEKWAACELRVAESTSRLLRLLEKHDVRATFFVLGWIAERLPELVREIEARGHEIALHGYRHLLLTRISPAEFESDLLQCQDAVAACGMHARPVGFRAPSFTLVKKTAWALEILARHGVRYDSSVFPVGFHPDYGIADAPLAPYRVTDELWEFPMSCTELAGRRLPCGGGGYFRLFPYAYTCRSIRRCNAAGRPVIFYVHPWELDPDQPRVELPASKRLRHYVNLGRTERRLDALLSEFPFAPIREVLAL